jgi:hypothetical protein
MPFRDAASQAREARKHRTSLAAQASGLRRRAERSLRDLVDVHRAQYRHPRGNT